MAVGEISAGRLLIGLPVISGLYRSIGGYPMACGDFGKSPVGILVVAGKRRR
jgi:hypothetical protein